jgi:hypothetical protein
LFVHGPQHAKGKVGPALDQTEEFSPVNQQHLRVLDSGCIGRMTEIRAQGFFSKGLMSPEDMQDTLFAQARDSIEFDGALFDEIDPLGGRAFVEEVFALLRELPDRDRRDGGKVFVGNAGKEGAFLQTVQDRRVFEFSK